MKNSVCRSVRNMCGYTVNPPSHHLDFIDLTLIHVAYVCLPCEGLNFFPRCFSPWMVRRGAGQKPSTWWQWVHPPKRQTQAPTMRSVQGYELIIQYMNNNIIHYNASGQTWLDKVPWSLLLTIHLLISALSRENAREQESLVLKSEFSITTPAWILLSEHLMVTTSPLGELSSSSQSRLPSRNSLIESILTLVARGWR